MAEAEEVAAAAEAAATKPHEEISSRAFSWIEAVRLRSPKGERAEPNKVYGEYLDDKHPAAVP